MKKRVLIQGVLLVGLSVVAVSTSTFAWISAQRKVSVSIPNFTVKTNAASINISTTINEQMQNVEVTDISGDGERFFKPILKAYDYENNPDAPPMFNGIREVTNTSGYYNEYEVKITMVNPYNDSFQNPYYIYLGPASTVNTNSSSSLKQGIRMSFSFEGGETVVWSNSADSTIDYIDSNTTVNVNTGTLENLNQFNKVDENQNQITNRMLQGNFQNVTMHSMDTTKLTLETPFLGMIDEPSDSINITVRTWLEGNEPDIVNSSIGHTLKTLLEFNVIEKTNLN